MEKYQTIDHSIITKFRPTIYRLFVRAIDEYKLIKDGDKVAVCISGGKDSMLLAKCMEEFQKHGPIEFEAIYLCMNPGYSEKHLKELTDNAKLLNIPLDIFETNIFDVVHDIKESPCYLCARMRRGSLYNKARELGCNKLALGHHYNDVIETTMLNVLYAGNFKTMLPKLQADNFEGIELIRPLYLVEEEYIKRFIRYTGLWPLNCACMVAAEKIGNKRHEIKDMIAELKKNFKDVDKSIFKSATNVNMNSILGWEKDGEKYSFLDPENPLE